MMRLHCAHQAELPPPSCISRLGTFSQAGILPCNDVAMRRFVLTSVVALGGASEVADWFSIPTMTSLALFVGCKHPIPGTHTVEVCCVHIYALAYCLDPEGVDMYTRPQHRSFTLSCHGGSGTRRIVAKATNFPIWKYLLNLSHTGANWTNWRREKAGVSLQGSGCKLASGSCAAVHSRGLRTWPGCYEKIRA